MRTIEFMAGTRVDEAAAELVHVAGKYGEAQGAFNEIMLTAKADTEPAAIVAFYNRESEAQAKAWRESPEGRAAETRQADAIAASQATHDRLVGELPALDFTNAAAVLDWLCAIQEATDHVGVTVNKTAILEAFTAHGFQPNVNCGADFKPDDRDNVFRWLVGQALDGLQSVAIHGVIHKFAADWKSKFLN
jgi:heme-degrading monooxygenase HmoA